MRAVIIHNPRAGTHNHAALDQVLGALREAGWDATLHATNAPGEATRRAREFAAQGVEIVFAAGGDGTLNEVANGIYGTRSALGVLPIGTANVWAKEMNLPLNDLVTAAREQIKARTCEIDVGEISGKTIRPRIFLLWCGAGYDAIISEEIARDPQMKRRWGALLYWLVGFRTAFHYRGHRVALALDGRVQRARVLLALVSNVQLYGGVVRIATHAQVDDGALDITIFHGAGFFLTAWHLIRVFRGMHLNRPDITNTRATEIEIRAKRMPVHVDGEPVGETPIRIRLLPRALRVLVPARANATLFAARLN